MAGESTTDEARAMVLALVNGMDAGSRELAVEQVSRRTGLGRWTVWRLFYGKQKSVAYSAMQALRKAYLDYAEKQLRKLAAEIRTAEMRRGHDDRFQSLASEASRLVDRLREARKNIG